MRRLILIVGLATTLGLVSAAAAGASTGDQADPSAGVALPLAHAQSSTIPPPGFTTSLDQAVALAKASRAMQAFHRRDHPLQIYPVILADRQPHWIVYFAYRGQLAAEADISPTGRVEGVWTGPQARATYSHGHYSPIFDSGWVVVTFAALFLLPFLDLRRLRRLVHLDALVLLSFLVSYAVFDHGHLQTAVWLVYPPLVYLLVRMVLIGVRRQRAPDRLAPLLPTTVLGGGLLVLVAARVWLSLAAGGVMDVGYASVIGAHRITHGQSLYFASTAHGDTYGPIAYLAYVPFELVFPWHGTWDYLASAHAASIAFDLVTVVGLVLLGRRMRRGPDGLRLGLALGWAWAACPFTLLGLMEHTNDGLIAMLSVLSLLVFNSPLARGAMLGLASAAKFSPAALLPLYAGQRDKGLRGTVTCVLSFVAVVALAIGLYLPPGGISEFYNHTIGFQLTRPDVFSPWALHPGLAPVKTLLEVGALLLAAAVAFVPRQRTLVQICALAAAVTIAVQLPAVHWFYYYIIWFLPFIVVALLAPSPDPVDVEFDSVVRGELVTLTNVDARELVPAGS